ncbi:hypothetical protein HPB48_007303 [Haemaphysalis longicornis]|uniref:Uncharacterized protein n=1 Tax=Haemaphysalis longicornis TaxID=44386 RepID=A0A9J6GXM3_HAELO|nr:hypothetical protein HPB48_007303 [Haemaphysalis longicornis]
MADNFRRVQDRIPGKVLAKAIKFCESAGHTELARCVKNSKTLTLTPFFTAKTHKTKCSFRDIGTERGAWQRCLGVYLQWSLSVLTLEVPFLVRSPVEVTTRPCQFPRPVSCAFLI